ncbi:MAG TPA: hypothetical protein VNJ10_00730 [Sphingomonas sp.]|nr:hypothetical protein [Sphingomonas sp.]
MVRPIAIVRYERLYWASFVLGAIVTAMSWSQRVAMLAAAPVLANATWLLPTIQAIGLAVTILLWYFTARSPSVVAKWVVVVLAALAVLGVLLSLKSLFTGEAAIGTVAIVSFVGDALYVAAATQLFQPGTKAWFGELPTTDEDMSHDI